MSTVVIPPLERFEQRILPGPGGCWLWTGGITPYGYARLSIDGRYVAVHRFSYELHRGDIPTGLEIDHLCRVRHCVNAWHLEPVTKRVNMLRGIAPAAHRARQTHCVRGHSFDSGNTYRDPNRGTRRCRTCHRVASRVPWTPLPDGSWRSPRGRVFSADARAAMEQRGRRLAGVR